MFFKKKKNVVEDKYDNIEIEKWEIYAEKIKNNPIFFPELKDDCVYVCVLNNIFKHILSQKEVIVGIGEIIDKNKTDVRVKYIIPNSMFESYYDYVGSSLLHFGFHNSKVGKMLNRINEVIFSRMMEIFGVRVVGKVEEAAYVDASENFSKETVDNNKLQKKENSSPENKSPHYTIWGVAKENAAETAIGVANLAKSVCRWTGSLVKSYGGAMAKDAIRMVANDKDGVVEMYLFIYSQSYEPYLSTKENLSYNLEVIKKQIRRSDYVGEKYIVPINVLLKEPTSYLGKSIDIDGGKMIIQDITEGYKISEIYKNTYIVKFYSSEYNCNIIMITWRKFESYVN